MKLTRISNDFKKTPLFYLVVLPLFGGMLVISVWEFGWWTIGGFFILFLIMGVGAALKGFG